MSLFAELKRRNVFRVGIAYGIIAWVLAQVADLAFDNFGSPEWVSKTVLFLLVLGMPLALFFAWAFELTPEGIKKESEVDRDASITPQTGQKLNFIIIGVLVIAVGLLLSDKFQSPAPESADEAFEVVRTDTSKLSIDVLPFENRSDRSEDAYFAEGIHDDLLTTMANIGSMRVISRTSVMEYKDTTKKIPEIAKELGVANILEGGVQRSGNQVRINVQLIDAETDEHLWAEIFDRELTAQNLFAIQSEVSKAIAQALHTTLSPEEQQRINSVPTQNMQAYEYYLLGRQKWTARTAESTLEATDLFQKAVDLDPGFAQAWAGLGDAYRHQVPYGGAAAADVLPLAEVAIRKALELDDKLGEAHASLGGLMRQMGNTEAAEKSLQRAIELNPNYSPAYNWLGLVYNGHGELEQAIETFSRGLELDPLSAVIQSNIAFNLGALGRLDEMRAAHERTIEIVPQSPFGYSGMWMSEYSVGHIDKSLVWLHRSLEVDSSDVNELANGAATYLDLRDDNSASALIDRATELRSENVDVSLARFYFALSQGNTDVALQHARDAVALADGQLFDPFAMIHLSLDDLSMGLEERALQRYESQFPDLFESGAPQLTRFSWFFLNDVIYLLRKTGDARGAEQQLDILIPYFDKLPVLGPAGYGPMKAVALTNAGRNDDALDALEDAIDAGWRWSWWYVFDHYPLLEPLRNEPRFQELRARVAADIAKQLENVRRMEASGELPTNWAQPAAKPAPPPI